MSGKTRAIVVSVTLLASALFLTEISARFILGLGNPPLFETSDLYGYRLMPNQDIRRFGNRIFYNAQGLRSEPITEEPQAGNIRILCIGDSITYGGSIIDQKETYPYQLEAILNSKASRQFEVLNASAPSWSIADEENYILRHGIYYSHLVILQISKEDLFQIKCSKDMVGNSPNYPGRRPILALQEIFAKYIPRALHALISKISAAETTIKPDIFPPENQLKLNLISLRKIQYQVNSLGGELIVVFIGSRADDVYKTPLLEAGKKQFFNEINALDIDFVNLDDKFSSSEGNRLLRDKIHPNPEGNRVIAEALANHILKR